MHQKLSQKDLELYRRCDEVLFYIWDPIGVATVPAPRDEYQSSLGGFRCTSLVCGHSHRLLLNPLKRIGNFGQERD